MRDGETIECVGVGSVGKSGSRFGELGNACDACVLFVELLGNNFLFSLADGGEDVGFALVVTVCTDAFDELE